MTDRVRGRARNQRRVRRSDAAGLSEKRSGSTRDDSRDGDLGYGNYVPWLLGIIRPALHTGDR